ncbi:hypothetical protein ACLOJK_010365 [Asimina triloba]
MENDYKAGGDTGRGKEGRKGGSSSVSSPQRLPGIWATVAFLPLDFPSQVRFTVSSGKWQSAPGYSYLQQLRNSSS